MWQILKNVIGKDLSKVTMPVQMNEPISLLQKSAEQLEHEYLLQRATSEKDPFMRLAYLAANNIAAYSALEGRTKKPFNPVLNETYEFVTPDFRFIAEQVTHHPPVCAFYHEGKGYKQWGNT